MMRSIIAITALVASVSAIAQTQVPNVFEDGTPATAAEVNENFQYVLENASGGGGCSATQQDNSVVIECADGTSGVIAGAGTVLVYPEGITGQPPAIEYNTGDIVLINNGDVILGKASRTYSSHPMFDVPVYQDSASSPNFKVSNNALSQEVEIGASDSFGGSGNQFAYYLESDCSGSEFLRSNRADVVEVNGVLFVPPEDPVFNRILFKARLLSAFFDDDTGVKTPSGQCESGDFTENATPAVTYTPAAEILNAAYPVRLEQLP